MAPIGSPNCCTTSTERVASSALQSADLRCACDHTQVAIGSACDHTQVAIGCEFAPLDPMATCV